MSDALDVLDQVGKWKASGKGVAIATVITTWGSSPRPVGSQLGVDDSGAMVGSVSGGCIEGAVVTLTHDPKLDDPALESALKSEAFYIGALGSRRTHAKRKERLAEEMERLHKSCSRLIWLNPLLRYGAYEPKSQGNKAMLPHVDEFRPVHNLDSLAGLIAALGATPLGADRRLASWQTELRKE